MRIVKSTIAIAVCYLVNRLRGDSGMVFYSQLAALWCIQMYRSNTTKNAIQRIIGTLVGAIFGLVYLLIFPYFSVESVMVSIGILLVLYTTVVLDKKQASYFSCVVFLSIVVNHAGDINPYFFVWNRFLDTIIGIAIGFLLNNIRVCFNPDRETLFVSGLDDTLLDKDEMLSPFSKVELNRMIDSGMKFTVSTVRTPASLIEPMRDIRLNLPVIAMDGAALYDTKRNSFLHVKLIESDISSKLYELIKQSKLCWYANVIIDDVLVIYYGDMKDDVNLSMVNKLKVSPYRNYIKRDLPPGEDVIYYLILDKTDRVEHFYNLLNSQFYSDSLRINTYPSQDYVGYSYIKIYDRDANKDNMLAYLKKISGIEKSVSFGTIPDHYDVFIHEDDANEVVRQVRKLYEPPIIRI